MHGEPKETTNSRRERRASTAHTLFGRRRGSIAERRGENPFIYRLSLCAPYYHSHRSERAPPIPGLCTVSVCKCVGDRRASIVEREEEEEGSSSVEPCTSAWIVSSCPSRFCEVFLEGLLLMYFGEIYKIAEIFR